MTYPILTFWISLPYSDYFITYVCKDTTISGKDKFFKEKSCFRKACGVGKRYRGIENTITRWGSDGEYVWMVNLCQSDIYYVFLNVRLK